MQSMILCVCVCLSLISSRLIFRETNMQTELFCADPLLEKLRIRRSDRKEHRQIHVQKRQRQEVCSNVRHVLVVGAAFF